MDKKTVLVVDDDEDLVKMLKFRIEGEGYEFMSAGDGKEMLQLLKVKTPNVIVLDVMLPNMDGYTALREMRKEEKYNNIPVIVLTAKEKKRLEDLFTLENIAFFMEKPFDMKELLQKIRELLGKNG